MGLELVRRKPGPRLPDALVGTEGVLGVVPVGVGDFLGGYEWRERPWAQEALGGIDVNVNVGGALVSDVVLGILQLGPHAFHDLVVRSETRSLGEIQDLALNRVRPQFATLPGLTSPPPFGGGFCAAMIPDRIAR